MSSLSKLSLRGVRAFSPEHDEQGVEFHTPITIITGANGCGKTTIIESLKYAVSGSMPPGCGRGQAFVHDPRSIGQQVVKANVKLRFTSKANQTFVVVRSMEVTQKKTNLSFKQMDGVLRHWDPDTGERVSLSTKCSDLDKQMVSLLGVQRAIMDHVLFCHQEEASWPLLEGAALKKRFDEIFDSSKYTKAIDLYKKKEKELVSTSKDLKADLTGLQSHKHAASGFQKELEDVHEQMEEIDEDKKSINQAIEAADEEIAKQNEICEEVSGREDEITKLEEEMKRLQSVVDKQREMLDEDLTGKHSVSELKTMLRDFDQKRSGEAEKLTELENECEDLQKTIGQLGDKKMALSSDKGKLDQARDTYESDIKKRNSLIESIVDRYKVDSRITQTQATAFSASQSAFGGESLSQDTMLSTLSPSDLEEFRRALRKKEESLDEDLKTRKAGFEDEAGALTNSTTDISARLKSIESDLAKLRAKRDKAQEEKNTLARAAHHSIIRKSDVEDARKQAQEFARKLEEGNNDPRRHDIPTQIRQLEEKNARLVQQIQDDKLTVKSLRDSAEDQNEISFRKDQCLKDLEGLDESMRDQSYALQKFGIQRVQQLPGKSGGDDNGDELRAAINGVHSSVQDKYDATSRELSKSKDAQMKAQQALSQKTTLLISKQQSLHRMKQKLDELTKDGSAISKAVKVVEAIRRDEEGGEAVSASSPRELLKFIDEKLSDVKGELAATDKDMLKPVVKRVIDNLRDLIENKDACPCCAQEIPEGDILAALNRTKALKKSLLKVDTAALERARDLEAKYQSWRNVVDESMNDLRDQQRMTKECGDLESEIQQLEQDQKHYQQVADDQDKTSNELQTEFDELRVLLDAANKWDGDGCRIADKKLEIVLKLSDLSASGTLATGDLKMLERELEKREKEKDDISNKISRLNKEHMELNNQVAQLNTQSTRMDKLARDKEIKFAENEKAATRKAELLRVLEEYGQEDKKLSDEVPPLKQKLRTKEAELNRLKHVWEDEEHRLNEIRKQFAFDKKEFEDLSKRIDGYLTSDSLQGRDILQVNLSEVQKSIDTTNEILKEKKPELDRLMNAASDHARHKKQLVVNIELLETEAKIQGIASDVNARKAEVENIEGYHTFEDRRTAAMKRREKKMADKARAEGRSTELWQQETALKRKLKTPEYKNIDERTRVAGIKYQTTKIAAEDVKKFYTSLDKALLQFHQVKIKEINKIIRELWLMTYKGEDITNIELRSGQEPGSKAAKSYNYRLVMTKGGNATLDMRGRCSAGQRVLASIVIRIALAETFGVDCGCLALDEPTVNLDERNKRGLAVALAQIVANRAKQRNFQLILITHDEQFVSMMKTELSCQSGFSMPESFYRVRRELSSDGKYYSKIDTVDWDELV